MKLIPIESYHKQLKEDIFGNETGLLKQLAHHYQDNKNQQSFARFALGKNNQQPEFDQYRANINPKSLLTEQERRNYVGLLQIIQKNYGPQLPSFLHKSLDELADNLQRDDRQRRAEKIEQLRQAKERAFQQPPTPQPPKHK